MSLEKDREIGERGIEEAQVGGYQQIVERISGVKYSNSISKKTKKFPLDFLGDFCKSGLNRVEGGMGDKEVEIQIVPNSAVLNYSL